MSLEDRALPETQQQRAALALALEATNVASANDFKKRLTAVKLFQQAASSWLYSSFPLSDGSSAASRACGVSTIHRESLSIIILHSSVVWITREATQNHTEWRSRRNIAPHIWLLRQGLDVGQSLLPWHQHRCKVTIHYTLYTTQNVRN